MSEVGRTESTQAEVSGWASGAATFASVTLMLIGTFQVINGLTALFNDEFFITGERYTFKLDITVWGWVHLLLGVVAVLAGVCLLMGQMWARVVAVIVAFLSALGNVSFIQAQPVLSVLMVALDIIIIWAVVVHGGRLNEVKE